MINYVLLLSISLSLSSCKALRDKLIHNQFWGFVIGHNERLNNFPQLLFLC